jgi:hypothetical protein
VTSAGGNKLTHDDIFLETDEMIDPPFDSGIRQDAICSLEGRGCQPALGSQRCTGES